MDLFKTMVCEANSLPDSDHRRKRNARVGWFFYGMYANERLNRPMAMKIHDQSQVLLLSEASERFKVTHVNSN